MKDVRKLKPPVMKKTLSVKRWEDDLACPKCTVTRYREEEGLVEVLRFVHLEDTDILFVTCTSCGHNWLMETADAE